MVAFAKVTTIFTQTRRSRQTSRPANSDIHGNSVRQNRTNTKFRQGLRGKTRIAVSYRDMTWHDTYGTMWVANLATETIFWLQKTIFLLWVRKRVRTLVWLDVHMQCTHVRTYSSMTSFSAPMPRLYNKRNHKLWTGFRGRGKGQGLRCFKFRQPVISTGITFPYMSARMSEQMWWIISAFDIFYVGCGVCVVVRIYLSCTSGILCLGCRDNLLVHTSLSLQVSVV